MPYVSRNTDGVVVGLYTWSQPDYATEFLPSDDPEVVAYENPPIELNLLSAEDVVFYNHENRIRAMEGKEPITVKDIVEIKKRMRE